MNQENIDQIWIILKKMQRLNDEMYESLPDNIKQKLIKRFNP